MKTPVNTGVYSVFRVELGGVEPPSGYAITSAFYMFRVRLIFENRPALP